MKLFNWATGPVEERGWQKFCSILFLYQNQKKKKKVSCWVGRDGFWSWGLELATETNHFLFLHLFLILVLPGLTQAARLYHRWSQTRWRCWCLASRGRSHCCSVWECQAHCMDSSLEVGEVVLEMALVERWGVVVSLSSAWRLEPLQAWEQQLERRARKIWC